MAKQLRIADWKTNWRSDRNYREQLRGYAFLGLQNHPDADSVYACIIWVREEVIEGYVWSRAELEDWWERMLKRIRGPERFNPGTHCRWCPRAMTCPALTAVLGRARRLLRRQDRHLGLRHRLDLPQDRITRANVLSELLLAVRFMESVSTSVRDAIRADVAAHGGAMDLGDGTQLELVQQQQRKIDFRQGWPILARRLLDDEIDQDQLMGAVTISKGRVEDAIRAAVPPLAPRGAKGKAVTSVFRELEERGAIRTEVQERLEIRRRPELETHHDDATSGDAAAAGNGDAGDPGGGGTGSADRGV